MIPFPDDSLTPEAIEMSLIANYAVPISQGKVVFEIKGPKSRKYVRVMPE